MLIILSYFRTLGNTGMMIDLGEGVDYEIYKIITMIGWIIAALIGAVLFALLGFTGLAKGFAAIAKILFYIFLVILAIVLIVNLLS